MEETTNETVDTTANTNASEAPAATADDAVEKAAALLAQLGPVGALRLLGTVSGQVAGRVREQKGDADPNAVAWGASADGMSKLVATLTTPAKVDASRDVASADVEDIESADESDEDDSDGEGDEADAEPAPRRVRRERPRMVAGLFEVSSRVDSCRLREVDETGRRGDLVTRVGDLGIVQAEWPIAAMSPLKLQKLTRGRTGKYMFEWFGRDESGKRVGLGRSTTFGVKGERLKSRRDRETPPPSTSQGLPFEQWLAMQQHTDDRVERERERYHREKERDLEILKHREELASKERIKRLEAQTRMAELNAQNPARGLSSAQPSGEAELGARLDALLEKLEGKETSDSGGLDLVSQAERLLQNPAVQMVIGKFLEAKGPPTAEPAVSPYHRAVPQGASSIGVSST